MSKHTDNSPVRAGDTEGRSLVRARPWFIGAAVAAAAAVVAHFTVGWIAPVALGGIAALLVIVGALVAANTRRSASPRPR
ncbi:hypothetical protein [Clavibacter michiganensis]|uniref:hypothetical protein n=1 Tax=Clavibacter michiganensis TaxID=28447 RepID=UPI0011B014D7|nr:hypothetical protein [Clavibacter michiganensis]